MHLLNFILVFLLSAYITVASGDGDDTAEDVVCGKLLDTTYNSHPLFLTRGCRFLSSTAKLVNVNEGCTCAFKKANESCDYNGALLGPDSAKAEGIVSYTCQHVRPSAMRKRKECLDQCGNVIGADWGTQPFDSNNTCIEIRSPPAQNYFMPGFCTCHFYKKAHSSDQCLDENQVELIDGPAHGKFDTKEAAYYRCVG